MTPPPLHALLDRLVRVVETDADLRGSLATLARSAAAWLDARTPAPLAEPPEPPAAPEPPPPAPEPGPAPEPPAELAPRPAVVWRPLDIPILPKLDPTPPPAAPASEEREDRPPMAVIAGRCRAKAQAARLLAGDPVDEAAMHRAAAALPGCRLWMLFGDATATAPAVWRDLAGAYEAAAAAADLLAAWDALPDTQNDTHALEVLSLAAEAQSTLMAAVGDTRMLHGYDEEQLQLFLRLRDETADRRLLVRRFMKRTDVADPANWADVRRRVAELGDRLRQLGGRDKERQRNLKNVLRKLDLVKADPAGRADEWPRVLELIDLLVADGLPPSHAELRDRLLAAWDHLPDDLPVPAGAERVFVQCERFLADRPAAAAPPAPEAPSAEVAAVARALAGRELVLIGGQARPVHKQALMDAFGLADVRWLSTPEHTSYTVFEPDIARPEVAVVVLAIRWMSHDYDRVARYCVQYDKPLVRLVAGYNPNQMAHQIMTQVGRRLGLAGD